ncbi:DUF262 domain-containing protein [Amycolatopsis thermoflava]|uniref:Uncharacterized protein DUF1524 n=1 Tax=Amycolatopsis thermoflava TaxID=84480 RepID=A0A3N2G5V8_9PSEU|nr:DUF262 domain-containing protein [Amycolatopsis thermoflava]ROS32028.1 uncharacterized protein DUF1524 [Amycolatopsis thermoflava]
MKPDTHTVKQLFERDVRYQIPLYQRPYVWNEEQQWAPLWEDLVALLQHQENAGESGLWSHFLGAIVLDQEKTAPGRIPRFTVIDGQQRLTTLQLLIAAVAQAAAASGADRDAKLLRRLVENDPLEVKDDERLKVWPTNANRESFAGVMREEGPPPDHVNDSSNLIDEAFDYFVARTGEYLTGAGGADDGEDAVAPEPVEIRAERLRITLCDLLKVVSITLEQGDNAQVIFETLNARGTPLLSLDLVKNSVFRQASAQGRNTDALYEQVWQPQLDDEYWRQNRRQGRLFRPAGELFLMHWLTMRLERVIPATELFTTFRQGLLTEHADAEALIRELCRDAAVMRSFDRFEPGTPEGRFFARLGPLDAGTVLPIVLLLFRSTEVSGERRRRALAMLESWLARRVLVRWTSKNYNRIVARLVTRMKADLTHADEALHAALVGGEGAVSRWPSDEEFVELLTTRDVYGVVAQRRLVMALAAVEASLRTSKSESAFVGSGLSVEHLLPQEWETHWPVVGADLDQQAEKRANALHRLGNLTIVAYPLNAALSNAPWSKKRGQLNQHSVLLLNQRLAERESWDERAIEEHGTWLAQRFVEIWPGPDAENWRSTPR